MFARALLAVLLLAAPSCGDRRLDLALVLASDSCTGSVPTGGSILYQITADNGAGAFCGACLPVTTPLAGSDEILGFLRANAPTCPGLAPGGSMRVALTAYNSGGCTEGTPRAFCSTSPSVPLPDGRSDALIQVVLACDVGCNGVCRPSTCHALGKNCDMVSDGCGGMLSCGTCTKPQECGGHGGGGIPNVCSK